MSEHWENVIEQEIVFYLNFKQYEEKIHELIRDVEYDIPSHVPVYEYQLGRIYTSTPSAETIALRNIERTEALYALLDKGKKRVERFLSACSQLDEKERDLVLAENVPEAVLKKMYRIYKAQRKDAERDFEMMLLEQRKEKARQLSIELSKQRTKSVS